MEVVENEILERTICRIKELLGEQFEEITVTRAVLGLFFSGVKLSTGYGGLCFTPIKEIPEAVCCPSSARAMPLSGKLSGRGVQEYLNDIFGSNILKRTLGIAVLNALSTAYLDLPEGEKYESADGQKYEILKGQDAFDLLELKQGQKTVVVGALVPILKRLLKEKQDFTVLEMDSRTLKGAELDHYAPATAALQYIPGADSLVITGATILNNSLEGLLAMSKKEARVLVTGPTVSMLPDAFFEKGVTMLGGVIV
ncbi:MAG: DUF364 domain-containing protein, partial [Desulfitobacteriaceae bacterium]|nr:DUF364 domain-containing protein [Desulfitobacteriaceae bacterium]